MLFDSPLYFCFLTLVVLIYWRFQRAPQNVLLLAVSHPDGCHLNSQGAERFSRQLAEQLAPVLPADARGSQRGQATAAPTDAVH